jgi:hypothetical protein
MTKAQCEPLHTWQWLTDVRRMALTKEHWTQVGILAAVFTAFVIPLVVGAIWITGLHEQDMARIEMVEQRVSAVEAANLALKERFGDFYHQSMDFEHEQRQNTTTLLSDVGDIKAAVAGKANLRQH